MRGTLARPARGGLALGQQAPVAPERQPSAAADGEWSALLARPLARRFQFEWGDLGDGSLWVRTPDRSVFRVGSEALRAVLDLDGGRSPEDVRRRYRLARGDLLALASRFVAGGAVLEAGLGRIRRARPVDDLPFSPWLLLALVLLVVQADFLVRHARTAVVATWTDGVVVLALALVLALLHEAGHWAAARPHFRSRLGLTWLGWFPAVYADTHEAWCLPRGRRLRISAAGCMADLVVHTILALAAVRDPALEYWVTPLLLTQYARWGITLNPLFEGDGYWLLADGLGITNLGTEARRRLAEGRRDLLALYALAAAGMSLLSLAGVLLLLWSIAGNLLVATGALGAGGTP